MIWFTLVNTHTHTHTERGEGREEERERERGVDRLYYNLSQLR